MRTTKSEVVTVNFPSLGYIEQFLRLHCCGDIMNTELGPKNITQLTRMFGAYVAYRRHVQDFVQEAPEFRDFTFVASHDYMKTFIDYMIEDGTLSTDAILKEDKGPAVVFNLDNRKIQRGSGWIEIRLESCNKTSDELTLSSPTIIWSGIDHKIISEFNFVVVENHSKKE